MSFRKYFLVIIFLFPFLLTHASMYSNADPHFSSVVRPILDCAQELSDAFAKGDRKQIPIISIGGCPGIGKTVFTQKLLAALTAEGISAKILKIDDYNKDNQTRATYGTGWDPRHLDFVGMHALLAKVVDGQLEIEKPTLDEVTREKGLEMLDLQGVTLALIDGHYALGTTPPLDFFQYADLGIYIEAKREDIFNWRWGREQKKTKPRTFDHFTRYMQDIFYDFEQNVAPTISSARFIIHKDIEHNYSLTDIEASAQPRCVGED